MEDYTNLKKFVRRSIAEQFYQDALKCKDDSNYYDYMLDDYEDEFDDINTFNIIAEEMFSLIHEISYYEDLIQLSDDRIEFDQIDIYKLSETQINDFECTRQMLLDEAINTFEKKTGLDLWLEGRSSRHICVENNVKNAVKYEELKALQKELQTEYIEKVNAYINEMNKK